MSIGAGLRTFLLADPAIAALVVNRVHPVTLPQGSTLPAVTYFKVSGQRVMSTTGPLGLSGPRVQIDCWGETYASAMAVAELVRQRLDGYRGAAGSQTIQGAFFVNEQEFYEQDPKEFRVSRDYLIWFEET